MEEDVGRVAQRVHETREQLIAREAIVAVLDHLRSSRFSSTTLNGCEVSLPNGQVGRVNMTVTGQTVNKIWQACCDSIIAQCQRHNEDSNNDN
jgi:hypothetical protein